MVAFKHIRWILLLLLFALLNSCEKEEFIDINVLEGSWKFSNTDKDGGQHERIVTFKSDFSGEYKSYTISGDTTEFESGSFMYTTKEDALYIIYDTMERTDIISYEVSKGTLTLYARKKDLIFKKM